MATLPPSAAMSAAADRETARLRCWAVTPPTLRDAVNDEHEHRTALFIRSTANPEVAAWDSIRDDLQHGRWATP